MQRIEAILLKKTPLAEADELIYCFSKERGKLHLRAKGIKKPAAKLAGSLQCFNWLEIYFVEGKNLPIITDTTGKQSFPLLKQSLEKIRAAGIVANTLVRILPTGSPDYVLWWQLVDYFNSLQNHAGREREVRLAPVFFVYKMLSLHGFRPELDNCLACHQVIEVQKKYDKCQEEVLFSIILGGLLHEKCLRADHNALIVSQEALAVIRSWRVQSFEQVMASNIPKKVRLELTKIVEDFSRWHLGSPIELPTS